MIKFEGVKSGDILWDVRRVKMGNTTMSKTANYEVRVLSVNPETQTCMVSWNQNQPQKYYRRQIERLRRSPKRAR